MKKAGGSPALTGSRSERTSERTGVLASVGTFMKLAQTVGSGSAGEASPPIRIVNTGSGSANGSP